jgi:lipoprotein NlpD
MKFICLLAAALLLSSCYSTKLPDAGASSQARQKATSHSKSKAPRKAAKRAVYTVRPNDTLYSIGKRFGVDYHTIAWRNRLRSPYRIYVGQHLYITRVAPRSQALPIARSMYKAPVKTAEKKKRVVKKKKGTRSKKQSHKTKARGYAKGGLLWPVKGKLTSTFGRRGSRMHDGIDISAKQGTSIHVADAGTVVYSDHRLSGYGKLVIVRHGRNLFTAYAHNQRNLVKKGRKGAQGRCDCQSRTHRSG